MQRKKIVVLKEKVPAVKKRKVFLTIPVDLIQCQHRRKPLVKDCHKVVN